MGLRLSCVPDEADIGGLPVQSMFDILADLWYLVIRQGQTGCVAASLAEKPWSEGESFRPEGFLFLGAGATEGWRMRLGCEDTRTRLGRF